VIECVILDIAQPPSNAVELRAGPRRCALFSSRPESH